MDNVDEKEYSIEILLPDRKCDREYELYNRNVKVYKYECSSYKKKIVQFYRFLKTKKYDVIHFHTGNEAALLSIVAKVAGNKKIIIHSHTTMSGDENKKIFHQNLKKIIFAISKLIYRNMSLCVACSDQAGQFMFGYNGKYKVLENGIDLKCFYCIDKSREEYSFCVNARFDPQKNPYFIIDIVNEIVKREPSTFLKWVGAGYMEKDIKKYTKELRLEKHVEFLGTTENVEKILWNNKYFLFPSKYEELGIVLIETQAAGLKCFASDKVPHLANCGGVKEISLNKTAKEWADIILNEMKNKTELCVDEEKLKKFDIHYTVKKLENIYDKI